MKVRVFLKSGSTFEFQTKEMEIKTTHNKLTYAKWDRELGGAQLQFLNLEEVEAMITED